MSGSVHISTIKAYFQEHGCPEGPIKLEVATVIRDPEKFVQSSISLLEAHPGEKAFVPYYHRLLTFYQYCTNRTK